MGSIAAASLDDRRQQSPVWSSYGEPAMDNGSKNILFHLLSTLYGADSAGDLCGSLDQLVRKYSLPHRARERNLAPSLTERDALLITYGDQVTEPGLAPLASLERFLRPYCAETLSGAHILPFYPYTSDDGFAVTELMAVNPRLGTWLDIARLRQSFDLMLDGVFNHLSVQSSWFRRFLQGDPHYADFFITVEGRPDLTQVVRPRTSPLLTEFPFADGPRPVWTTFSADQADLNFKNPSVLLAVLDALLFYVAQGARFIRLDAIAFLWKEIGTSCLHLPKTHVIVRLMRALLDKAAPHVLLVTETNVPHADNISYFGDGTNEAQLVYNFALPPLVLHSFAAGNVVQLTRWAQSLAPPSDQVTFFNFLASHDGIGLNPVRGILSDAEIDALAQRALAHGGFVSSKTLPDGSSQPYELNINYLDALSNPAAGEPAELAARKLLTAHAILLSLRGVPGIYFHSLFGSRGDRPGADASGIPRRINRQKLARAQLERELADPTSLRARVFSRLRGIMRARRGCAAFHPRGNQEVLALDQRVFTIVRTSPDGQQTAFCCHNLSPETVTIAHPLSRHFELRPFEIAWLVNGSRLA